MESTKSFKFAIGLLYPAVLGSIIYSMLEHFSVSVVIAEPARHVLFALIVVQYVLDYLYTNTDKIRVNYNPGQGICDFVVVVLLFASAGATSNPLRFHFFVPYVALLLAGTKVSCLIWELVRQEKDRLARWSFAIFGALYGGVQAFSSGNQWVLVGLLTIDIVTYLSFESIRDHLPASFQPEGGRQGTSVEGKRS